MGEATPAEGQAAEPTQDDINAQVDDLLMQAVRIDDDGLGSGEEAPAEPEPPEPEPEPEPEATQEAATAEEPAPDDGPPPEDAAEPEQADLPPWRQMQAKRYKRQAQEALDAVQREREQIAKMQADMLEQQKQLAEQTQLAKLMQTDPVRALELAAKSAGKSATQFYDELTQAQLGGQLGGAGSSNAVLEEIQSLRAELQAQKDAAAKAQQEAQQLARRQQWEQLVNNDVQAIASVGDDERAERWPFFAKLPAQRRVAMAREAVNDALSAKVEVTREQVADYLDRAAKREIELWKSIVMGNEGADPAINGANGQGHRAPAQNGANAGHSKQPAALSNADAAATSGARRDMTEAERNAQADDLFEEAFAYAKEA